MDKLVSERRQAPRRNLRVRVRLYDARADAYQNAHLENISATGMYLITRRKLRINQILDIAVPSETHENPVLIKAKVVRKGNHRSWGLFSYACRITDSGQPMNQPQED